MAGAEVLKRRRHPGQQQTIPSKHGGNDKDKAKDEDEGEDDESTDESIDVIVLRRIGCHYNPVWVDGQPRTRLCDTTRSFRDHFGL